ncbi:hypothetical protein D3C75_1100700 [compost metagenome]
MRVVAAGAFDRRTDVVEQIVEVNGNVSGRGPIGVGLIQGAQAFSAAGGCSGGCESRGRRSVIRAR